MDVYNTWDTPDPVALRMTGSCEIQMFGKIFPIIISLL